MCAAALTCPSCGAVVAGDRLTCPSCGALVAAGTGSGAILEPSRRQGGPVIAEPAEPAEPVDPAEPGEPAKVHEADAGAEETEGVPGDRGAPDAPRLIERPLIHDPLAPTPPTPAYAARPPRQAPPAPPGHNEWFSTRPADQQAPDRASGQPTPSGQVPPGPVAPGRTADRPVTPGQVGFLSDLPFDAPDTLAAWLTAAGLGLLSLSFLLPWAAAPGLGWFDTWGLREVRYLVIFFAAVAAAIAVITPSRLTLRVRFGYLPVLVGAVGFGLFWDAPVVAPAVGVWALAIGSMLAVVGGLWTLVTGDRQSGVL